MVANEQLQREVNALKNRNYTDFLSEKLDLLSKEKISNVILPAPRDLLTSEHNEPKPCFSFECRLEGIEQHNRRECLLFFGLTKCENEDCVDKIVQTAFAMGMEIMHDDVSDSHRLHRRNRGSDEARPIIAKFARRNTKTLIYESKQRLNFSKNHFNVFVREQLTKERARVLYWMKNEGYRVTTYECRLMFK